MKKYVVCFVGAGAVIIGSLLPSGCAQEGSSRSFGFLHQPPRTLDDYFAAVAHHVPAFGGLIYTSEGDKFRVFLTQTDEPTVAAAREAIRKVFGAEVIPAGGIELARARYGFLELKAWYDQMLSPDWSIKGVTLTDIDEARNRLRIGVETDDTSRRVLEQLASLNIPRPAIIIEVTGPITPTTHTVQSAQTPRHGGYVITRLICNAPGTGISSGTLGFIARRNGGLGFVTNPHNTRYSWRQDQANTCPGNDTFGGGCAGGVAISIGCAAVCPPCEFHQAPGYFPAQLIGQEAVDPGPFTGAPCPAGQSCRWSESAFIRAVGTPQFEKGVIARTTAITTVFSSPILSVSLHAAAPTRSAARVWTRTLRDCWSTVPAILRWRRAAKSRPEDRMDARKNSVHGRRDNVLR